MPVAPISGAVSEDEAYVAGGWASSSPAFAISRGTRAATPSTPSLRSTLPHHAIFPSRSRVQVGWASRRSPPPKPPPPAGAIQRRVKRRTSCCLSAAGIRFLGVLFPPRDSASLTVGLPPHPPGVVDLTGFPRSTRASYGRVGCHLYPGDDGVPATVGASSVAVCRFSTACPSSSLAPQSDPGSCRNEASTMVHSIHPSGLPLTCSTQSERAPLGFPLASHPAISGHARQGGDRSRTLTRSHVLGITPTLQSTDSLTTCDLVSQRTSAGEDGSGDATNWRPCRADR